MSTSFPLWNIEPQYLFMPGKSVTRLRVSVARRWVWFWFCRCYGFFHCTVSFQFLQDDPAGSGFAGPFSPCSCCTLSFPPSLCACPAEGVSLHALVHVHAPALAWSWKQRVLSCLYLWWVFCWESFFACPLAVGALWWCEHKILGQWTFPAPPLGHCHFLSNKYGLVSTVYL